MIGLDTNILVRFLTQDDPRQSPIANELLERRLTESEPGFVGVIVLAETVWVLERRYRLADDLIARIIEYLLRAENLVLQSEPEILIALATFRSGKGKFADSLIGAVNAAHGCELTLSFDRKALRLPGFAHP